MTDDARKRRGETVAAAVSQMARAGVEFALIVYVPEAQSPMFVATDEPPMGLARVRAALDAIELHDRTLTCVVPPEH